MILSTKNSDADPPTNEDVGICMNTCGFVWKDWLLMCSRVFIEKHIQITHKTIIFVSIL